MPVCITGMHRSGTSLVAHVLQACGVNLGDERDLVPASPANPDGYWEHRRFVEINEELLRILGGDWATPATIPESSSAVWQENADLARVRKAAQDLCASFGGHGVWGWKDPRSSIALPFWLSLVPDLKVVISVRHPLEVAASLKRVDPNASIADGVGRWLTYSQHLMADAPVNRRLLTHAGSYFCEPAAEIQRIAGFAGLTLSPETLKRCVALIRPDLRRNRFTADEVADFDLPHEVLDLYGRMCEEAGWDEGRARALTSARTPTGAVAIEEFERLFAARSAHARRLAATDAMFVKQREDFLRELDRRDDDLLWAMQTGITVRGTTRDYRRKVEYHRMVRQVRRVVRDVVPPSARMLVMSRGDDELLVGPEAQYFPQRPDGGYAGYHPASSLAAIGHLEALRSKGANFLVVPTTELWFLDEYRDFGRHVRDRYRVVLEDKWSCTIFALSESGMKGRTVADELQEAMSACEEALQREPAILDWGTGLHLATQFPDRTVFGPPVDDGVLPYLDHSVDVVAVSAASPERHEEAQRVSMTAVLVVPEALDPAQALSVRWATESAGRLPSVSLIVPASDPAGGSSPMLASLSETLPSRFKLELVVGSPGQSCNEVAARATGDVLVFLEPGAIVLPGWLPPLLRIFRDRPEAGAAGGKVLAPDGRLEYGGGIILAGGALQSVGEDEYAADGPASDVVRTVDWCSPVLLATRRTLFTELGGFDGLGPLSSHAAADYCLRLRDLGHDVLFQPDTAAVRVEASPGLGDPPAAFIARWSGAESVS